ncbi:hypothetical protein MRX96_047682 [Rhipicephalus microplus]
MGLSSADVRDALKEAGYSYSHHSVMQSELRVLKTLQYRLQVPTPLVYAEVLLEVIAHQESPFKYLWTILFTRVGYRRKQS